MLPRLGKTNLQGRAGIALTNDGLAYAGLTADETAPVLEHCGFAASRQSGGIAQLEALTRDAQFQGSRLAICLDRTHFNLSQVEAPPVEQEEMLQALNWKVKDLIDFPLEELVLDYVNVPPTKSAVNMVYTVTSQESVIRKIVDRTGAGEGSLERIDIPALALQNIASRLPQAEEGIALLNLTRRDSLLILGRGEKFYLSRGINTQSGDLRDDPAMQGDALFDNLLLDVQRSLDYYDSFFADPPIRHLLVPAADSAFDELIDYLNRNLAIDVDRLTLDEVITPGDDLSLDADYHGELMLALGSALWQRELAS